MDQPHHWLSFLATFALGFCLGVIAQAWVWWANFTGADVDLPGPDGKAPAETPTPPDPLQETT